MKLRILLASLFISIRLMAQPAPMIVTNEVRGTFDSSSYDTAPYILWGAYFNTYFVNMYPQYTNGLVSVSRSGASWQNQFENQQEQYCLSLWALAPLPSYDFMLANDNGAYLSADVVQWGTNLFTAPLLFWNGTAKTNEGYASLTVTHYALGANINSVSDGDNGAVSRNSGATNVNGIFGNVPIDGWHDQFNNGFNTGLTDETGANWFYALGHLTQKAGVAQMTSAVKGLGLETNVGSICFDWSGVSVANSNKFAASSLTKSGSTFSCTLKADRMPPSWDIVPSVSNNVSTAVWGDMPNYGSVFQWVIQFTNLPAGTYGCYLDNQLWDVATASQWSAGRNQATNYANPTMAFNAQRTKTLYDTRDKYGVDHITCLPTHTAGDPGILGPDLINYQSNAFGQWQAGVRGSALVSALSSFVAALRVYDVKAHDDAQQTNHTFQLVLIGGPAPFR